MELPEVGAHCAIDECNALDFLPISCSFCNQLFCPSHSMPETHNCDMLPSKSSSVAKGSNTTSLNVELCGVSSCKLPSVQTESCAHCSGLFCERHRFPEQHECWFAAEERKKAQEMQRKQQQLKEKREKALDVASKKVAKRLKTRKSKMSQKLIVMKLRGRAVPICPPSSSSPSSKEARVVVAARLNELPNTNCAQDNNDDDVDADDGADATSCSDDLKVVDVAPLVVPSAWTIGKLLDHVGKHLGIVIRNNDPTTPLVHAFLLPESEDDDQQQREEGKDKAILPLDSKTKCSAIPETSVIVFSRQQHLKEHHCQALRESAIIMAVS